MPRSNALASVFIETEEQTQELPRPEPDSPFHILVAGDFSGGANRRREPIGLDRDNFDDVLRRIAPELRFRAGGGEASIAFRELDDFHPDRILERLEPFRALRNLRLRLGDRDTFAAAAAEIAPAPGPRPEATASGADLLRAMMGEDPEPKPAPRRESDWNRMLREMVAPYAEAGPDPRQAETIAQVDRAIAGQMRAILHHPLFQALESAWRGVYFLTRRLETGEDLKLYLLDMPQADAVSAGGLADLRRIVVDQAARTPGARPWAVIAGIYAFGPEQEEALAALAAVARDAGAPLVAGLAPEVAGLTRVFEDLRRSAAARWVGLALPRFLLRLPYGKETDPAETFAFEEMPSPPEHERYLWGHPALACACLLGEAFSARGWRMQPGMVNEIDGLPLHVIRSGGESELKPCAEVLLTEDAAELLLDRGFIPLASIKGTGRVRVVRFQSVADPAAPLAGRWR